MGSSLVSNLKQALLLDQHAFLQVPEIEMGLAAGHYDVAVRWVKVCSKHRLVGALNRMHKAGNSELLMLVAGGYVLICLFNTHAHTYLHLSQPVLSLPVPDGEDVVIGVIHNTQCVSSILRHKPMFMY